MDTEPKTAAEMKEIRLNRKLAQDAEGIKAMADIAAADVAIRKRTEKSSRDPVGQRGGRPQQTGSTQNQTQEKEDHLACQKKIASARISRFHKSARNADDAKSGKTERDAAAKAVIDNMAKLKALRLAREAAEPPRPASAAKKPRAKSESKSGKKAPALGEWLAGQQSGGRRT